MLKFLFKSKVYFKDSVHLLLLFILIFHQLLPVHFLHLALADSEPSKPSKCSKVLEARIVNNNEVTVPAPSSASDPREVVLPARLPLSFPASASGSRETEVNSAGASATPGAGVNLEKVNLAGADVTLPPLRLPPPPSPPSLDPYLLLNQKVIDNILYDDVELGETVENERMLLLRDVKVNLLKADEIKPLIRNINREDIPSSNHREAVFSHPLLSKALDTLENLRTSRAYTIANKERSEALIYEAEQGGRSFSALDSQDITSLLSRPNGSEGDSDYDTLAFSHKGSIFLTLDNLKIKELIIVESVMIFTLKTGPQDKLYFLDLGKFEKLLGHTRLPIFSVQVLSNSRSSEVGDSSSNADAARNPSFINIEHLSWSENGFHFDVVYSESETDSRAMTFKDWRDISDLKLREYLIHTAWIVANASQESGSEAQKALAQRFQDQLTFDDQLAEGFAKHYLEVRQLGKKGEEGLSKLFEEYRQLNESFKGKDKRIKEIEERLTHIKDLQGIYYKVAEIFQERTQGAQEDQQQNLSVYFTFDSSREEGKAIFEILLLLKQRLETEKTKAVPQENQELIQKLEKQISANQERIVVFLSALDSGDRTNFMNQLSLSAEEVQSIEEKTEKPLEFINQFSDEKTRLMEEKSTLEGESRDQYKELFDELSEEMESFNKKFAKFDGYKSVSFWHFHRNISRFLASYPRLFFRKANQVQAQHGEVRQVIDHLAQASIQSSQSDYVKSEDSQVLKIFKNSLKIFTISVIGGGVAFAIVNGLMSFAQGVFDNSDLLFQFLLGSSLVLASIYGIKFSILASAPIYDYGKATGRGALALLRDLFTESGRQKIQEYVDQKQKDWDEFQASERGLSSDNPVLNSFLQRRLGELRSTLNIYRRSDETSKKTFISKLYSLSWSLYLYKISIPAYFAYSKLRMKVVAMEPSSSFLGIEESKELARKLGIRFFPRFLQIFPVIKFKFPTMILSLLHPGRGKYLDTAIAIQNIATIPTRLNGALSGWRKISKEEAEINQKIVSMQNTLDKKLTYLILNRLIRRLENEGFQARANKLKSLLVLPATGLVGQDHPRLEGPIISISSYRLKQHLTPKELEEVYKEFSSIFYPASEDLFKEMVRTSLTSTSAQSSTSSLLSRVLNHSDQPITLDELIQLKQEIAKDSEMHTAFTQHPFSFQSMVDNKLSDSSYLNSLLSQPVSFVDWQAFQTVIHSIRDFVGSNLAGRLQAITESSQVPGQVEYVLRGFKAETFIGTAVSFLIMMMLMIAESGTSGGSVLTGIFFEWTKSIFFFDPYLIGVTFGFFSIFGFLLSLNLDLQQAIFAQKQDWRASLTYLLNVRENWDIAYKRFQQLNEELERIQGEIKEAENTREIKDLKQQEKRVLKQIKKHVKSIIIPILFRTFIKPQSHEHTYSYLLQFHIKLAFQNFPFASFNFLLPIWIILGSLHLDLYLSAYLLEMFFAPYGNKLTAGGMETAISLAEWRLLLQNRAFQNLLKNPNVRSEDVFEVFKQLRADPAFIAFSQDLKQNLRYRNYWLEVVVGIVGYLDNIIARSTSEGGNVPVMRGVLDFAGNQIQNIDEMITNIIDGLGSQNSRNGIP